MSSTSTSCWSSLIVWGWVGSLILDGGSELIESGSKGSGSGSGSKGLWGKNVISFFVNVKQFLKRIKICFDSLHR